MESFLTDLKDELKNPESYLNPSEESRINALARLKKLFSLYQKFAREDLRRLSILGGFPPVSTGPLRELYTDGLDGDQVWEQIQMVNEPVVQGLTPMAAAIYKSARQGKFQVLPKSVSSGDKKKKKKKNARENVIMVNGTNNGSASGNDSEELEIGSLEEEDLDEEEESRKGKGTLLKLGRKSVVDDTFFKLSEMERFLEIAEKQEEEKRSGK